jgi:hypothetical protein
MTSAGDLTGEAVEQYLRVLRAAVSGTELATDQIKAAADQFLPFLSEAQREVVMARWRADRVELEPSAMLRGEGGKREWFADYDPSDGYHWRRLRDYLITEKNRTETVVGSLDETTDQILEMLEDPRPHGPAQFCVKGLVIGYVQSGKTANFSALIAKSFDAGYRIVIVLSGLHNSLRRQTQLRLEDELGLVPSSSKRLGVGLADDEHQISRMTRPDSNGDFQAGTADSSMLYGGRTIMVVKKNASVLRRLVTWLEERQPITMPVLIIDDEADQASINTGGNRSGNDDDEGRLDELTDLEPSDVEAAAGPDGLKLMSREAQREEADPSVINGLVRRLLDRMRRAAYVGYTATPFANVLIGHDSKDKKVGEDLYPSDFILSLPRPPGYIGPERLFGRLALAGEGGENVDGLDVIRKVPDWQADILLPGRRGSSPAELPESLDNALLDFVLATAARDARTGTQDASCMLIHASQRTAEQDVVAELVRERMSSLRQRWRYQRNATATNLRARWESEFVPVSAAFGRDRVMMFEGIEEAITQLFRQPIPVLALHNKSQDELDYERTPTLRAVLVGGNKLSRGLTLEGLLVSFYVRKANAYDTLLQMGRWFGYREQYVDLTRLHTTGLLIDRFRDLATYEEELRREIRLYDLLGRTPMHFGPRIRKHHAMQITAPNRMGSARSVAYSYSASVQQTIGFRLDDVPWLLQNLAVTRRLLSNLGAPTGSDIDSQRPTWRDVDWRHIEHFLSDYKTHPDSTRFVASRVRDYVSAQATRHSELTRWIVSVRGLVYPNPDLGTVDLAIVGHDAVNLISRAREMASDTSIGTLINPISSAGRGDEDLGLSPEVLQAARDAVKSVDGSYPRALRERRSREEGLLLIYPISQYSKPHLRAGKGGEPPRASDGKQNLFVDPDRGCSVIGIAASLPDSTSEAALGEYVVGSAGAAPA